MRASARLSRSQGKSALARVHDTLQSIPTSQVLRVNLDVRHEPVDFCRSSLSSRVEQRALPPRLYCHRLRCKGRKPARKLIGI